ncbi:hypothetical protein PCL_08605 [Purpureocillium lilacinum]|uniref:Uncharacterized protein n=1 Tax=Purpureocillium lilacinum TaxID=33203 RepID=A0A2U3DR60_PURLI|nr:hypothetical protein PCL_08605 [Purpureocillium lilacinum]
MAKRNVAYDVLRGLLLNIPGLRNEAVEEYCVWHCSKVRSKDQTKAYELARDLTLARSLDLELVYEDNYAQIYIDNGVSEGVARRFVRDVQVFLEECASVEKTEQRVKIPNADATQTRLNEDEALGRWMPPSTARPEGWSSVEKWSDNA